MGSCLMARDSRARGTEDFSYGQSIGSLPPSTRSLVGIGSRLAPVVLLLLALLVGLGLGYWVGASGRSASLATQKALLEVRSVELDQESTKLKNQAGELEKQRTELVNQQDNINLQRTKLEEDQKALSQERQKMQQLRDDGKKAQNDLQKSKASLKKQGGTNGKASNP
jgi:proteasome assembly chaperone (PAC2) family protein